jgi:hypothetical protein
MPFVYQTSLPGMDFTYISLFGMDTHLMMLAMKACGDVVQL